MGVLYLTLNPMRPPPTQVLLEGPCDGAAAVVDAGVQAEVQVCERLAVLAASKQRSRCSTDGLSNSR